MGSFQYVHLMGGTVNFHGDNKVRVIDWLQYKVKTTKLKRGKHTLKLLCTRVSSRSITIHFFCKSWCLAGGRRNDIRSVATYCEPSVHCSGAWVLSLSLPKQQSRERRKPRVLFFCVCDVVYSAFWASFSFIGRFPGPNKKKMASFTLVCHTCHLSFCQMSNLFCLRPFYTNQFLIQVFEQFSVQSRLDSVIQ